MGLVQTNQNWIISSNSILQQCKSEQQFMDKVVFIQSKNINNPDLTLQTIDIFRLKQTPYQSFMKSARTFQHQSPKLLEYCQTLNRLSSSIIHKNLAPIHFVKMNQENGMCMRSVKMESYATYYGIDLRDIIENRKQRDSRFSPGQILYVAKSLIGLGKYLKQHHQISFGLYQSKNIFASDNGYLKLYLFHILPENKHINYFNLLSIRPSTLTSYLPLAPEMLPELHANNLIPSFDYFKADIFQIGMILIDMIMQNSLQRYYRIWKDGIVFDQSKIKKDLQQLRQNNVYDQEIIYLMENILETNPCQRWTFQQADYYLQKIKKQIQFACKLNVRGQYQEQQKQTKQQVKKISFKSQQPQSQYVLKSIKTSLQQKLNPLPLKSLSKLIVNKDQSKQTSQKKSIYTRRRNTGVSIISSSSYQNYSKRSTSKKNDNIASKFTTVRNSRVNQLLPKIIDKSSDISQLGDFQTKFYCSERYLINTQNQYQHRLQEKILERRQKINENWLTLGSTRITQQNSKTFGFLPPKAKNPYPKSNPKLQIHRLNSQNQKERKKETISTHIKMHRKNIVSPNKGQTRFQTMINSKQGKQNISPSNKMRNINEQKTLKTVRPKMKINHHFRA